MAGLDNFEVLPVTKSPVVQGDINALAMLALQARDYDNHMIDVDVNKDPLTDIWKFPVGFENDQVNLFIRDAKRPLPDVRIAAAFCIGPAIGSFQLYRLEQLRLENHAFRASRPRYKAAALPHKYCLNSSVLLQDPAHVDRPEWDTLVPLRDEKKAKKRENSEFVAMTVNAQAVTFDRFRLERFHDILEIALEQARLRTAPVITKE